MAEKLTVELDSRSYDIIVNSGVVRDVGKYLPDIVSNSKLFIVTDENVAKFHLPTLEEHLTKAGLSYHAIILPAGESTKSFEHLQNIIEEFIENKNRAQINSYRIWWRCGW